MPTTSRGWPYPSATDVPDGPDALQDLAVKAEAAVPLFATGTSTVVVTAATSGNLTGIALPASRFPAAPKIVATVRGSAAAWGVATDTVTASSFTLRVRHIDGTSTTSNVVVDWVAIYE